MGVTASGPPFDRPLTNLICECGWMWKHECKKAGECGLNQGMPEYNREGALSEEYDEPSADDWDKYEAREQEDCLRYEARHTPYEFLEEPVDLNKVCREVVEDLVKDSKSTQVGGTHYAEMAVQPWSAMRAWMSPEEYIGYHIGTVIGYLSRHKKKGGQVDIDKALHHMQELSRYLKEDAEYPY